MATYDDFDGVYFTIQALRLYHPEIMKFCEILVEQCNLSAQLSSAIERHGIKKWSVLLVGKSRIQPDDAPSMDAPWIAEIHSPVHHTGIAYNCSIFNYFLENVPAEEELLEDWLSANGSLEKFLMTLPLAVQVE